jgi:peptide/nickel transport system substrate-binding protein
MAKSTCRPLYGYDIEKAKALVAERRAWQPGSKLTFTTLAGSADDATIFAALQQMWAPLGVDLVVEQVDGPTRGAKNKSGRIRHPYLWLERTT